MVDLLGQSSTATGQEMGVVFFFKYILIFCCQISVKCAKIISEEPNISEANAKPRSTLIRSKIIIDNPEIPLKTLKNF